MPPDGCFPLAPSFDAVGWLARDAETLDRVASVLLPQAEPAAVRRVVVSDSRNARDGRSIEALGHYNPRTERVEFAVDEDKAKAWLAKGARPSEAVERLFRNAGILPASK